jgi:lauroyl/myristoyl acyltransferase
MNLQMKQIWRNYGKNISDLLEDTIRQKPEYWLWSHKRWKHNVELDS